MNYPIQHPVSPLTKTQMNQLLADLNEARVATLKKGRTNLSYIEAWDARRSMIRIFGFGGYSTRVVSSRVVHKEQDVPAFEYNQNREAPKVQRTTSYSQPFFADDGSIQHRPVLVPQFNWSVVVEVTYEVYVHQLGAVFSDVGAAGQTGPEIGEVADFAAKTASSDAFKRCVMNLGTQFGLSLYDNGKLGDVVQRVMAPGQRALDVDWAAFHQANVDIERKAELEAARAKQQGPQGGAAPGVATAPTSAPEGAPTADEQAAATTTLAKGFGGQP